MVTMTKDGEFARLGRLVESDACQRWLWRDASIRPER